MKPNYQRFFLTELVALIQQKYKIEFTRFFYEGKREYTIMKPEFMMQTYTEKEAEKYNCIFVINFFYLKIIRKLY
jgi:hypothetical protein